MASGSTPMCLAITIVSYFLIALLYKTKFKRNQSIMENLFIGLVSDTNRFLFNSNSATVLITGPRERILILIISFFLSSEIIAQTRILIVKIWRVFPLDLEKHKL